MLKFNKFVKSGKRTVKYVGAGGNSLGLEDYVVDMVVDVIGFGKLRLRNVLVANTEKVNKVMLVGRHDMTRLKVTVDFNLKAVSLGVGHRKNTKFEMRKRLVRETIGQFEANPWGPFHLRALEECPIQENQPETRNYQIGKRKKRKNRRKAEKTRKFESKTDLVRDEVAQSGVGPSHIRALDEDPIAQNQEEKPISQICKRKNRQKVKKTGKLIWLIWLIWLTWTSKTDLVGDEVAQFEVGPSHIRALDEDPIAQNQEEKPIYQICELKRTNHQMAKDCRFKFGEGSGQETIGQFEASPLGSFHLRALEDGPIIENDREKPNYQTCEIIRNSHQRVEEEEEQKEITQRRRNKDGALKRKVNPLDRNSVIAHQENRCNLKSCDIQVCSHRSENITKDRSVKKRIVVGDKYDNGNTEDALSNLRLKNQLDIRNWEILKEYDKFECSARSKTIEFVIKIAESGANQDGPVAGDLLSRIQAAVHWLEYQYPEKKTDTTLSNLTVNLKIAVKNYWIDKQSPDEPSSQ